MDSVIRKTVPISDCTRKRMSYSVDSPLMMLEYGMPGSSVQIVLELCLPNSNSK